MSFKAFLTIVCSLGIAYAQVDTNSLYRVLMIQNKQERGSIFALEVDGREYWITAKHLLTGAKHPPYGPVKEKSVILSLLNPRGPQVSFIPEHFTVLDPGDNIDIVVLAADKSILDYNSLATPIATGSARITFGGICHFIGYALGGGWLAYNADGSQFWRPFIKGCTVSGFDREKSTWFLDGYNIGGFSGGPVTFTNQTGAQQIAAVISGFVLEPTNIILQMHSKNKPSDSSPRLNSKAAPEEFEGSFDQNTGLVVAFDIGPAIETIHDHPIGPLRPKPPTK